MNLDDSGATSSRYRLLRRIPENTKVLLTDRAVTRIELADATPVKVILPPAVKGQVRDFFVRIVITADAVPEITFAPPDSEIVSFEDMDEDVFKCEIGANVFAFTETEDGILVSATDRVKTGVSKLYAQWAEYVDPFVGYICEAKNLTFHSDDEESNFIDVEGSHEFFWRYTKDSSVSEGRDCAWVDDVVG